MADNLPSHPSNAATHLRRAPGNDLIFLPPSSPDLNPIEPTLARLKALIRKAAARTHGALW